MTYPLASHLPHDGDGVPVSPSFPEVERWVGAHWEQGNIFRRSVEARPAGEQGSNEFVFYDGPPFANGLPHYGHLLTGYVKDVVPRYQTMRGRRVERRFGWDTHGLPAELEAMNQLGITETAEIEAMGIAAFNEASRASVLRYTKEWEDYVRRQGRWVDFENDYKTLDLSYMESVMWAFKQLYDKGLAYEGYYVLPYCWRDETPLSNHELRMDDDVYADRQDNTVTVTFPLVGDRAEGLDLAGVRALAWTTTPWTLPTNIALAVGPEVRYAVLPAGPRGAADGGAAGDARYLLAHDLVGAHATDLGYESAEDALTAVAATYVGTDLEGLRYEPLFDYYADAETYGTGEGWRILVADYVTTTDGTGLVHQAPAYGEEDYKICTAAGLPTIVSVDSAARFLAPVRDVAGMQVFDANRPLTQLIKAQGRLLRQQSYVHSYPHCWRCRTPLIYKAVGSWFVRTTAIKDRMLELNDEITWVPEHIQQGSFRKWLEGNRDWSISRSRYWGSPIPVWKSDNPDFPRVDVYGSLDEIERDFGVRPTDLHRPFIDDLVRPNPDDPSGRSTMRRVPDVLDCWFESGSMSFAQVHYPFENQDWFEHHFPGDFIVEYIGQVRGWFYTMHVMATALFDRPAFTRALVHGILLGSDGLKMSKSLRNYPDVSEVFDRDGADAMRWFLMSSPVIRGGTLVVTEQGIRDGVRQVLLPLWSSWYFFALYANALRDSGYDARRSTASTDVLDRYLLSKTSALVTAVGTHLDSYDLQAATEDIRSFVDVLTNWYIRRSRDRFWDTGSADQREAEQAFDTLWTVLETLCRVAAPFLPHVTEEIWRGLTGGESVHLADWPDASDLPCDEALVTGMDRAREVCSASLALRKAQGLRVRLPLQRLTVVGDNLESLAPLTDLVADEVNVREVVVIAADDPAAEGFGVEQRLSVNARAAGPRLGKEVQGVIRAAKEGQWQVGPDGEVMVGEWTLLPGEFTLETVVAPGTSAAVQMLASGGFVALDTVVTPDLEAEGTARDVIRAVQQARRDAGLQVSDRIALRVSGDEATLAAVQSCAELVCAETLATTLDVMPADSLEVQVTKA